jgi:hypothetical protein
MGAKKESKKKKELEEEQVKLKQIDDDTNQQGYEYVAIPPDGGFGWIVVFAAMVFTFVLLCLISIFIFLFSYVTLYVMVHYLLLVQ